MNRQDATEAEARRAANAFRIRHARRRFKGEPNPNGLGFRAWARRTYGAHAATGKLGHLVARKDT